MKKWTTLVLAVCFLGVLLGGCAAAPPQSQVQQTTNESTADAAPFSKGLPANTPQVEAEQPVLRVAGLKGPTTMGMVKLMDDAENGMAAGNFQFEMFGTADEIVAKITAGELDAAAIPANLAAVLYAKTGAIQVAAINTLGVLYVVETGDTIHSVADLKGRTVYSTGKGTTPEFALNTILTKNGLDPAVDVTIEYKSESTEIAALLQQSDNAVAVLPQPYVTAVEMLNSNVRTALSLSDEWDKVNPDSRLITGVLVVRAGYLEDAANKGVFAAFLDEYKSSIEWVNANVPQAAMLVAKYGIVEKTKAAEAALPLCNITYIDGDAMQTALEGYLQTLCDQKPEAVGGQMPDGGFYFEQPLS